MPIYEYQCDDCEHKLEALQKMSDDPLKLCPECGENSLRKLVSAAAFRLSGSGWYETDFKDKKEQKNLSKSDNKPSSDGGSKKTSASPAKTKTESSASTAKKDTKTSSKAKSTG
ncbi:MAG: zinc ribbon domain-containing protein [Gammaproteobacteria bacterium]|nr:zinc ribbon domain-containing protein [Gammaproteobacteria bacterium]